MLAATDLEVSHPVDPPYRLLRAHRERPCGSRAAEQRDELAPLHCPGSTQVLPLMKRNAAPSNSLVGTGTLQPVLGRDLKRSEMPLVIPDIMARTQPP
jgi:hypothetical protein